MGMTGESVEGKFCLEIYSTSQHGTMIAKYKDKAGKEFTVTGMMLPTRKNIVYRFSGEWTDHPKYGKQYKALSYEEMVGNDRDSLIAYLASGIIQGIGKATAAKIVDHFGAMTLQVLDNDIDRLCEVHGISFTRIEKIKESYRQNRQARDVILKLGKYGISPKLAMESFLKFKEKTMEVIEHHPYKLCFVSGISFAMADSIAERTEDYERDPDRFSICAQYVLLANESNTFCNIIGNRPSGSLGMDKDDFGRVMYHLLRYKTVDTQYILERSIQMLKKGGIVYRRSEGKNLFYLPGIYRIEVDMANQIHRLASVPVDMVPRLEKYIQEAESDFKIDFSPEQKAAIIKAFQYNLSLVIGPPGTGKTTMIKGISYIYKRLYNKKMQFVAPSGMAASRIKKTTGENASTVHSALGIGTEILMDEIYNEEYVMEDCLLIIDEMSMMDSRTAYRLFAAIRENCRIVICGDDEQLPSVGAGAVLRDMIDSHVLPMTYLTRVYRQSSDKNNYINSFLIRDGKTDLYYDDSFQFIETDDPQKMEDAMINTYIEKVREYGVKNVMLISPFYDHAAGVKNLNARIHEIINPSAANRKEVNAAGCVFRVGDEVMNLKNDKESNVVNGEIGTISEIHINDSGFLIKGKFLESERDYTKDNIKEITHAYAYTVHKAQGSEAKCVITCIHRMHSIMLRRNIYYTAVTRAADQVITFGQKDAMIKAILTEDKTQRNTLLKSLLMMRFGKFVEMQGA